MKRFAYNVGYNLRVEDLIVLGGSGWELVAVVFTPARRLEHGGAGVTLISEGTAFYFKKELSP